jgi:hypothetical protein
LLALLLALSFALLLGLGLASRASSGAAALCCFIGACAALVDARRGGVPRTLELFAKRPLDAGRVLPPGSRAPGRVIAKRVGRSRLVLQCANGARAVVWRDATDPDSYRRLAALARWSPGRESPL